MFEKIIQKNPAVHNDNIKPLPTAPPAASIKRDTYNAPPVAGNAQPSDRPAAGMTNSPAGQRNILSNDVEIKGTVRFQNDLLVDGKIEGEISSDGSLTVAENAHIKAEIKTRSVIIYGKVHGNIIASERVEVKTNAELVGDIKAPTLSIEPGAIFVGKSEVGTPSAQSKKEDSKPATTSGNDKNNPNSNNKQGGNSGGDNNKQGGNSGGGNNKQGGNSGGGNNKQSGNSGGGNNNANSGQNKDLLGAATK